MKEQNFLMLAHAYPPFGGGGVQRISKFAVYLKEEGWDATVLAPNESSDSWIDQERMKEVSGVEVIRLGKRNLKNDPLYTRILRRFFPADAYFMWAVNAWKLIQNHPQKKWKLVLSSSPPHSIHLAGMWIARSLGIPWVADFRDHFTLGPEYRAGFIKRKADLFLERQFLKNADALILNTETNRRELLRRFPEADPQKIHVIYNGFDHQDLVLSPDQPPGFEDRTRCHLLYLGGLRGDHIDGTFYHMLAQAIRLRPGLEKKLLVHIVGDVSRKGSLADSLGLNSCMVFSEAVAYNKVADFIHAADACLTWQRPSPRYKGTIAGKLFDYIGMQKPVFSLGQKDGEIAGILSRFKIGLSADPAEPEAAAREFLHFLDALEAGEYRYPEGAGDFLSIFDRRSQSAQLAAVFNHIAADKQK